MLNKTKTFTTFAILFFVAFASVTTAQVVSGSSSIYGSSGFSGSSSYAGYVSTQSAPTLQTYYGSQMSTYWPILGNADTCEARQDLLLTVPPAGCQPPIVRSDLLAEQNVPVFCQIDSVKINPLVDINAISGINFVGNYPPEVAGTGFHPARAALRSGQTLLGAPLLNNIGYVVVVLKRQPDESKLPDFVNLTLGAQIQYTTGNAYGIGSNEFVLSPTIDSDWETEKNRQSFWNGRYFVRLEDVDSNLAIVSIYNGDQKVITQRVNRGTASSPLYVPGMYCRAGLQISYDGFVSADQTAKIEVSDDKSTDVFEVVQGSSFMNGRCSVSYLGVGTDQQSGRVVLSCGGKSFELVLGSKAVSGGNLTLDGINFKPTKQPSGYYELNLGSLSITNRKGIYTFSTLGELSKRNSTSGIVELIVNSSGGFVGSASVYTLEDRNWFIQLWTAFKSYAGIGQIASGTQAGAMTQTEKYFGDAIVDYEKVADSYPAERSGFTEGTQAYGEIALENGIRLSQAFGKDDTERRLISKLLSIYPQNTNTSGYGGRLNALSGYDSSAAVQAIEFQDGVKVVRLLSFNQPKQKSTADFIVGGNSLTLNLKDRAALIASTIDGTAKKYGELYLETVDPEQVSVKAYCVDNRGNLMTTATSYILRTVDQTRDVCGLPVKLVKASAKNAAKIRLYPLAQGTQTLTNLTIGIGIEKRAIQIAPDKAREKIKNINESIKQWEDISKKLGSVVTGLKTACFATSAVLTFKNFATGLSGETIARQKVMTGDNGWRNRCSAMVGENLKYSTMDQCYIANSAEIDAEVDKYTNAINSVNSKIEKIQNGVTTNTDVFGQSVDTEKMRAQLADKAIADYGSTPIDISNFTGNRKWVGPDGKVLDKVTVADLLSKDNMKNNAVSVEEIKNIMLNAELSKPGSNLNADQLKNVNSNLQNAAGRINDQRIAYSDLEKAKQATAGGWASAIYADPKNQAQRVAPVVRATDPMKKAAGWANDKDITSSSTLVVSPSATDATGKSGPIIQGGRYYLGLQASDAGKGIYGVKNIYYADGNRTLNDTEKAQFLSRYGIGSLQAADRVSYNNEIAAVDRKVRYFETEPYRGMPAIVPFDIKNGWYAATRQTLPIFGGIGAFDASGRVTSFWLCNVGDNSRIEFESGYGDDLCQQVNLNTGQPLGSFPGMTDGEARTKIAQATSAIEQAARQYPNKFVTINGQRLEVGAPSTGQPGTSCQDFMSPKDCLLLFNVCDPVICPPSRCNLGGKFYVANVAQSGIVGSIFLCLPNIREGVVIPVCLTGIQAGIDGWISIMKNYRDCLQENLNTGQTVGICDEIHSIYICEFFWGQVAPFVNVIIPKLIESAYGQGVRGGGEYLTVQSAWQNMENSMNYFTNQYAVNSLQAFQARTTGSLGTNPYSMGSIAEIGSTFCKSFISAKAPAAFQALVEPDSPPQFHAWFDEKAFTTATVPATSQYKVFYHIFAGNDAGVQFSVYLKNPPASSYYMSNPYVQVASGYIAKGQYASETKDFTAPQGYKELCVRVNADEECGFGQVSTSFAVDYLNDAYVKSELTKGSITSERTCISGSNNPGALLNPNVQAGVENFVSPNIYNKGVVRICSTSNPGAGTDPTRFVNMGYCDDPKVGCWLDKQSVNNALTAGDVGMKNQTLQELQTTINQYLLDSGQVLNDEQASAELNSLQLAANDLKMGSSDIVTKAQEILSRIDYVMPRLMVNGQKAYLLIIRGQVNDKVARSLKAIDDRNKPAPQTPTTPSNGGTTDTIVISDIPTAISLLLSNYNLFGLAYYPGNNPGDVQFKMLIDKIASGGFLTDSELSDIKTGSAANNKNNFYVINLLQKKLPGQGTSGDLSLKFNNESKIYVVSTGSSESLVFFGEGISATGKSQVGFYVMRYEEGVATKISVVTPVIVKVFEISSDANDFQVSLTSDELNKFLPASRKSELGTWDAVKGWFVGGQQLVSDLDYGVLQKMAEQTYSFKQLGGALPFGSSGTQQPTAISYGLVSVGNGRENVVLDGNYLGVYILNRVMRLDMPTAPVTLGAVTTAGTMNIITPADLTNDAKTKLATIQGDLNTLKGKNYADLKAGKIQKAATTTPSNPDVLLSANTNGQPCKDHVDCAVECSGGGLQAVYASKCDEDSHICVPYYNATSIQMLNCPIGSFCTSEVISANSKQVMHAKCASPAIVNCDGGFKLYDAIGGGLIVFFPINTNAGFFSQQPLNGFASLQTTLPVKSPSDLIDQFAKIKTNCNGGVKDVLIVAHGYPGGVGFYGGYLTAQWCSENKARLQQANPFVSSGGRLVLDSCSVNQAGVGADLANCLVSALGVKVYVAPCRVILCSNGVCSLQDPSSAMGEFG
jgi:hypothetical protein